MSMLAETDNLSHFWRYENAEKPTDANNHKKPLRIGLLSSFVPNTNGTRVNLLDHVVNKACYSHMWGYDYIFNTTPAFSLDEKDRRHWLRCGCWHRPYHLEASLKDYDWILYGDIDYVIKDMSRNIESFVRDWEFHQNKDVHVFVPRDFNADTVYTFSNFCFMIRNSPFGHAVLKHWIDFGEWLLSKRQL